MSLSLSLVILDNLLAAAEALTAAYLADGLFARRRAKTAYYLLLPAFVILSALNASLAESAPLIRIANAVTLYGAWARACYKSPAVKCLCLSGAFVCLQNFTEILVLAAVFSRKEAPPPVSAPYIYYSARYTAKLFAFLAAVAVRAGVRNKTRQKAMSWPDWLQVLFFPAATAFTAFYLTAFLYQAPGFAGKVLVCVLVLAACDAAAILLLNQLEHRQDAALENVMLRQGLKTEKEHVSALQESYDGQRKLTHDFNGHLAVLMGMTERGAPREEVLKYLRCIRAEESPAVPHINTNRTVADIVLTRKYMAAQNSGILFELMLEDLSAFPLPDDALAVVLTNLLDNAIEACEKIPVSAERRIFLKMQRTDMASFLYIENTTAEPVRIRDGWIAATKENAAGRGYGLKNVRAALTRHGAMYAMDYKEREGTFCFSFKISEK